MLFRVEEPATIAPKTCSGESKKSIDGDNGTCETKRRANEAVTETPDEVSLLFLCVSCIIGSYRFVLCIIGLYHNLTSTRYFFLSQGNTSGPERYVPEQTSNTAASTTDPNRSGKRKNTLGLMERYY